ncbi:MAG: hypothetical protein ACI9J2_001578 [Saprospiraceae bacterium]|jgi:hypothetical protein
MSTSRKKSPDYLLDHSIDLSKSLIQKRPKFKSHTTIFSANRAYLKPTISPMLFCLVYIVVGLFLIGLAMNVYVQNQHLDFAFFMGGFGVAIATFGFTLIKPFFRRVIFDKATGEFVYNTDRQVKLKNIIYLQINNKIITSKHGWSYPCYELNMLTKMDAELIY